MSRAFLDFAFKWGDLSGQPRHTITEDRDTGHQERKLKHLAENTEEVNRGGVSVEEQVREPDGVTAGSGKVSWIMPFHSYLYIQCQFLRLWR